MIASQKRPSLKPANGSAPILENPQHTRVAAPQQQQHLDTDDVRTTEGRRRRRGLGTVPVVGV
jgi:hypothetical protein